MPPLVHSALGLRSTEHRESSCETPKLSRNISPQRPYLYLLHTRTWPVLPIISGFFKHLYITGYHVSCRLVDMRRRNAPYSSWPGCDGAHVTASLLHGATVQSATITTCSGWQGTVSAEGSGYMYSNLPGRSYQAPDLHRTRNEAIMTSRDYLISS